MTPRIRVTAILIEDDSILLVKHERLVIQSQDRWWSLPGGGLEWGETIEEGLVREVREETGLDVTLDRLLYVCDRIADGRHVLHITFAVTRVGGDPQSGVEPGPGANPILRAAMVPLSRLGEYGFSELFCQLVADGFPESGTYQGSTANIGL